MPKKITPEQPDFENALAASLGEEQPKQIEEQPENPTDNIQDYGFSMPQPSTMDKIGAGLAGLGEGLSAAQAVKGPNTGAMQAGAAFKAALGMASSLLKERTEALNTALERLPLSDVSPALAKKFPSLAGMPSKMAYETIRDIQTATAKTAASTQAKKDILATGSITESNAPNFADTLKQAGISVTPDMLIGLDAEKVLGMARAKAASQNNKVFANAAALRKEHFARSKDYITVRNNFGTIKNAETDPTGVSDMSLIFAYMKILDPNSVVRESEYATAQNAGSVPETVRGAYNKAISGEKLAPSLRNDFIRQAKKEYATKSNIQLGLDDTYRKIAEKSNIPADEAVISPVLSWGEFSTAPVESGAANPPSGKPKAKQVVTPSVEVPTAQTKLVLPPRKSGAK